MLNDLTQPGDSFNVQKDMESVIAGILKSLFT